MATAALVAATLQRLALGMRRATEEFTIMAMHAQAILPHSLLTQFPADSRRRLRGLCPFSKQFYPPPQTIFVDTRGRQAPPCSINLLSQYLGVRQNADDGNVTIPGADGTDRKEPLPAFLRFALCHHKIFRSFLVCLFWALHSDWEGDIAEIRVFRGDGRHRRLGSL